jgi:hypothetical protein
MTFLNRLIVRHKIRPLNIEFDDGTTPEINLDRVKGISIQPVGN